MSTTDVNTAHREHVEPSDGRPEARGRRDPGLRRRSFEGVLRAPRLAARRGLQLRQRLPRRAVHAAGIRCIGAVRHEHHDRRHPVPPKACTWSCPTSRRRATELAARGADVTEVFHPGAPGGQFEPAGRDARVGGIDEHRASYGSFAILRDPDGNALAAPRGHDAAPGPHRRDRDHLRVDRRPRGRDAARIGRARRTRSPHRQGRSELARLVRGLHGRRAGRHAAARMSHTSPRSDHVHDQDARDDEVRRRSSTPPRSPTSVPAVRRSSATAPTAT